MLDSCSRETLKPEKLKLLRVKYEVDLVCLTEINKFWRLVHQSNTIWNETEKWNELRRVQVGHNNSTPPTTEHKVVGNAMIAFDDVVFRISDQGYDERLLERWVYFTIKVKNRLKTTSVTCYYPYRGESHGSVYFQHLPYTSENIENVP